MVASASLFLAIFPVDQAPTPKARRRLPFGVQFSERNVYRTAQASMAASQIVIMKQTSTRYQPSASALLRR